MALPPLREFTEDLLAAASAVTHARFDRALRSIAEEDIDVDGQGQLTLVLRRLIPEVFAVIDRFSEQFGFDSLDVARDVLREFGLSPEKIRQRIVDLRAAAVRAASVSSRTRRQTGANSPAATRPARGGSSRPPRAG